jgi:deoxycytidylate deaminase
LSNETAASDGSRLPYDAYIDKSGLRHQNYELVFAFVSPVGTDLAWFHREVSNQLIDRFKYAVGKPIRLSEILEEKPIREFHGVSLENRPEHRRIDTHMDAGDALRGKSGRADILALLSIVKITNQRLDHIAANRNTPVNDWELEPRRAFILSSLKNHHEVFSLRRVYGPGFFLIAVHSPKQLRVETLAKRIAKDSGEHNLPTSAERRLAVELVEKDEAEPAETGQQVGKAFHQADFFLSAPTDEKSEGRVRDEIGRLLDLAMGDAFKTPERDEYFMNVAHAAGLRSGSLSRQVGAALVSKDGDLQAIGCNDVPCAGGGLYWPNTHYDRREIKQARDSSDVQKEKNIVDLLATLNNTTAAAVLDADVANAKKLLKGTRIMDAIEFSRACHAEAEAILACARLGVSPKGSRLFSTLFPCHDCTKLIVAAGIASVVFIEPYPKSLAAELHGDSIAVDTDVTACSVCDSFHQVAFTPFMGVGPRRFREMFSMADDTGDRIPRKKADTGERMIWGEESAVPKHQMQPVSYLEREKLVVAAAGMAMTKGRAVL